MSVITLFVYGTLMEGFRANDLIPEGSVREPAYIIGNLYHYSAGYPIVQIPKDSLAINGSRNYDTDLMTQDLLNSTGVSPLLQECDEFGKVYGELCKIPYSKNTLQVLDCYEGCNPAHGDSLYVRTLCPVYTEHSNTWAWVYNMDKLPERVQYVESGDWRSYVKLVG